MPPTEVPDLKLRSVLLAAALLFPCVGAAAQTPAICGDCNGDGGVNILDALLAAQNAVGTITLVDPEFAACNTQGQLGDSTTAGAAVNILDAFEIASYAASLLPSLSCTLGPGGVPVPPWATGSYFPPWQSVAPLRVIPHTYDAMLSPVQNGAALATAVAALAPGDRLDIASGTYSVNQWWNVVLQGTASAPIWIVAAAGANVVITRPDAAQNVINLAAQPGDRTEFVCLRGLEITGGDTLIKLYRVGDIWIDQCHIHDGSGVGIAANSADVDHLYITRNEIHDPGLPGDTSEGMYLGANSSASRMVHSIIALNHVHHCGGTQGDGIEVKQGSHTNWIAENLVHDTNYPCLIAYGTDGLGLNLIERNTLYTSNDNTMQVQGEAIVRNNLIMDAAGTGFQSQDHQGQTRDLVFVNNTIVTRGRATNLTSWNGRAGMVLANNVIYSRDAESIRFPSGSSGVTLSGNVTLGAVQGAATGSVPGVGLADFVQVAWDASLRDAHPAPGSSFLGAADPAHAPAIDLDGASRTPPHTAGAYQ